MDNIINYFKGNENSKLPYNDWIKKSSDLRLIDDGNSVLNKQATIDQASFLKFNIRAFVVQILSNNDVYNHDHSMINKLTNAMVQKIVYSVKNEEAIQLGLTPEINVNKNGINSELVQWTEQNYHRFEHFTKYIINERKNKLTTNNHLVENEKQNILQNKKTQIKNDFDETFKKAMFIKANIRSFVIKTLQDNGEYISVDDIKIEDYTKAMTKKIIENVRTSDINKENQVRLKASAVKWADDNYHNFEHFTKFIINDLKSAKNQNIVLKEHETIATNQQTDKSDFKKVSSNSQPNNILKSQLINNNLKTELLKINLSQSKNHTLHTNVLSNDENINKALYLKANIRSFVTQNMRSSRIYVTDAKVREYTNAMLEKILDEVKLAETNKKSYVQKKSQKPEIKNWVDNNYCHFEQFTKYIIEEKSNNISKMNQSFEMISDDKNKNLNRVSISKDVTLGTVPNLSASDELIKMIEKKQYLNGSSKEDNYRSAFNKSLVIKANIKAAVIHNISNTPGYNEMKAEEYSNSVIEKIVDTIKHDEYINSGIDVESMRNTKILNSSAYKWADENFDTFKHITKYVKNIKHHNIHREIKQDLDKNVSVRHKDLFLKDSVDKTLNLKI